MSIAFYSIYNTETVDSVIGYSLFSWGWTQNSSIITPFVYRMAWYTNITWGLFGALCMVFFFELFRLETSKTFHMIPLRPTNWFWPPNELKYIHLVSRSDFTLTFIKHLFYVFYKGEQINRRSFCFDCLFHFDWK